MTFLSKRDKVDEKIYAPMVSLNLVHYSTAVVGVTSAVCRIEIAKFKEFDRLEENPTRGESFWWLPIRGLTLPPKR